MGLSSAPTALLQVFAFGNASFRKEVNRRMAEREAIRSRLVVSGNGDIVASLRRCEKGEAGIVGIFAFLGLSMGFIFRSPPLALSAAFAGVVIASILSGIMTDNAYKLSSLIGAPASR